MKRIFTLLIATISCSAAFGQLGRPVPIDSIQFVTQQNLAAGTDEAAYFNLGDEIIAEGVVCEMHPGFYGLSATSRKSTFVFSTDGNGRWKGIEVMADPGSGNDATELSALLANTKFYDNFIPGLTVKFISELGQFQGNTQLYLKDQETEVTNLTPTEITPVEVHIDSFKNVNGEDIPTSGEPYEHVYVEFKNVTVVDREEWTDGRWNWSIQNAAGLKLSMRDFSGYFRADNNTDSTIENYADFEPPAEGTVLQYIRGVIVQNNFGGYQLAPLVPGNVGLGDIVPPVISGIEVEPSIPTSSDDIDVSATIVDDGSVASADIYYAVGIDSEDWQVINMSNTDGDTWIGTIPAQADGSLIKYYITSEDDEGYESFAPNQTGDDSYIQVLDGGITSISQIQNTVKADGSSLFEDATLSMNITATVTATVNYLGITALQDGTDKYSGILVNSEAGDGIGSWNRGDIVTITEATIIEDFGVTYLEDLTYTVEPGGPLLTPVANLDIDSVSAGATDYAEAYEGMYVEWTNVVVNDTAPDFPNFYGEFGFGLSTDEGSESMRVDDLSPYIEANFAQDSVEQGQNLDFIRGILYYSFGNWKLLPRDKNDIDGYFTPYPNSLSENSKKIGLSLFPQPATSQLNISFDESEAKGATQIEVFNMSGKLVLTEMMSGNQKSLDVTSLQSGVYIIKLKNTSFSAASRFIAR